MAEANEGRAAAKALVRAYCRAFYDDKDFARARAMLTPDFHHHGVGAGPGADRLIARFRTEIAAAYPRFRLDIHRCAADGDLVWTYGVVTGGPVAPHAVVVDLWRVAGGLLAEQWAVGQRIEDAGAVL